jgi:hypothetical protein
MIVVEKEKGLVVKNYAYRINEVALLISLLHTCWALNRETYLGGRCSCLLLGTKKYWEIRILCPALLEMRSPDDFVLRS